MTQTSNSQRPAAHPRNPHAELLPLPPEIAQRAEGVELLDPTQAPAVRWGILGAGWIGSVFAHDVAAYSSGIMEGVAARDPKRAEEFAEKFGVNRAFESYEALLADPDIDVVYIAAIHPEHEKLAIQALEAGKPILVEKCFTMDAAGARRVVELARSKGLFCMEAMWTRHLPHQKVLTQILRNGSLGAISTVFADHGQDLWNVQRMWDPQLGGGALLDLGVYSVSFVQQVLPDCEVVGSAGKLTELGVDVENAVLLRTEDATATATSNFNGRSATFGQVVCEKGTLEMPEQFYRPTSLRLRVFSDPERDNGVITEWDGTVPGGFQYQAAEVARCLAAGLTESATMPLDDTIRVMELLDTVREQLGVVYPWEKEGPRS
ncbi:Gfo/Idh/MocA family oxidoreductase [Schaalia sp. ZJ405]|uniref:Gfo/Idh/MocA family protein n=1 Tax=unclassified Schaalia TaxID=2691889 RepID=UPI0013EADD20|nr:MULTISPECIES: Gfo/Idh/MocA family oxidoreductase [unclassified Schaalia]QPK81407.1 Gfo/Idh/MocA family oxidoreductase [Schaalia sp. ZJ405]